MDVLNTLIRFIRTEYTAPFNPRGDSYQSPSSSSAGSAAASAAYHWLDFTIGTDTGGSTRQPAGVCGTYGMRLSTNFVSTAGVYTVSPLLDSIGIFARSAHIVEAVVKVLMEPSQTPPVPSKSPTTYKLLYPTRAKNTKLQDSCRWFPHPGEPGSAPDAEDLFEATIQKLESYLKCTRTPINIDDLWRRTRPAGLNKSLNKATGSIYMILSTYTCVRSTIDPFIADFKAANNNRLPFIDSAVNARHDYGRSTTSQQHETATEAAQTISRWVRETLFAAKSSPEDESFPLLIFPQSWGVPAYRDDPDPDAGHLFSSSVSFSSYSLSHLSGCPDCTVPIGEVSRISRVTQAEMFLPVSLSVLSPPGTDLRLARLLSELEDEGVLRPVMTGTRMFVKEEE